MGQSNDCHILLKIVGFLVTESLVLVLCGPEMLSRQKLSGDHPETTRGWSPDFFAKSLVIPAIYTLNL